VPVICRDLLSSTLYAKCGEISVHKGFKLRMEPVR